MSTPHEPAASQCQQSWHSSVEKLAAVSQLDFDIEFFDTILQRAPDYVDVLRRQGEQLSRKGRHLQALEVDRHLVRLLPADCVVRYNLACSLAMNGLKREAIAALRRSLECGYSDFEFLRVDEDLDSLRSEQGFRDLIREYAPTR